MPRAPHSSSRGGWTVRRLIPIVLAVLFPTLPHLAQTHESDGQWWWDAEVTLAHKIRENLRNGSRTSRYDDDTVDFRFGVNGYIVHPAFVRFRLETEARLQRFSGGGGSDTSDIGLGFELEGFPRGRAPFDVYYRSRFLNYSDLSERTPTGLLSVPDTSTEWGGNLTLSHKIPGRVRLGLQHSEVDFVDGMKSTEVRERKYLEWITGTDKSSQLLVVEKNRQDHPRIDLNLDDLAARFRAQAVLGDHWIWVLNAEGGTQTTQPTAGAVIRNKTTRVVNKLDRPLGERHRLKFLLNTGRLETGSGNVTDLLDGDVRLTWFDRNRILLTPSLRYASIDSDDIRLEAPTAGLTATWRSPETRIETVMTGTLTYGRSKRTNSTGSLSNSRTSYLLNTSLNHGTPSGLRKSLDLNWSENQFRLERGVDLGLIDRDLLGAGLGGQDQYTGRISLAKTWGRQNGRLWLQHGRFRSSDELSTSSLETRTTQAGLDVRWNRFMVRTNLGRSDSRPTVDHDGRQLDYLSATTTWVANRYLTVRGIVRADRTDLAIAQKSKGLWLEGSAKVNLGLLSFEARVFDREEEYNGTTRNDRGLTLTVRGRYADWLPIVTGTGRRGVIR